MNKSLELLELFHQGTATKIYEVMGAHPYIKNGEEGYIFRVWAPKAKNVYIIGSFNEWDESKDLMNKVNEKGIWEIFIENIKEYTGYKYVIEDYKGRKIAKADPYGFHMETRPATASKTYDISNYVWKDEKWIKKRRETPPYNKPLNIYEVHLGSWRKYPDGNYFDYYKLAYELIPYVKNMGYTHIELMPVCEYPFDGSWGYQIMGYYAPTSRYGNPEGFMNFIDKCHKEEIGVILDWVPGHFPKDRAGLFEFDGSSCYEYEDPLKREHEEWGTMIFDWGKNEVKSFLISNAMFWLEKYHVDGLRVDAVAAMLYLDYNKGYGKWRPNVYGGKENLEAVEFLKDLNKAVFANFPNILMIAEESTAWPMVTKPVDIGGLGFNFKWNMGWMNDTLSYMKTDPFFRKGGHNKLTFSLTYVFSENFILPLSHDEVVHMKGSLINKMTGEYDNKFANLRAYYALMMAHPGKKLLFMGGEFAQFEEWHYEEELEWGILNFEKHKKMKIFTKELNHFYLKESCLWEMDDSWDGFRWIDPDDSKNNVISFKRINIKGEELIVVCNFSPLKQIAYKVNVALAGKYKLIMNSDNKNYGGEGIGINTVISKEKSNKDKGNFIEIILPPLSTVFYKRINGDDYYDTDK
ncbi:1,4-alpha-glucan branching protein GlgB, partial [Anaerovorax odorimutans]|uniref:1,4-alpha-glucan branching protein GlgB n=1 Tax=Anaerovorax odorimutans TaxID=109327 RepID=UPI000419B3FE